METGRESWRSDGTRGEWWCDPAGRWLLATAVLAGRAGRAAVEVHRSAVAVLLASLAGAVVLNVLKEEVPEERSGDSRAFASAVPSSSSLGCNRFAGDSDGIAR